MSVQLIHRSLVIDYMYTASFFIGPVPSSWIFRALLIFYKKNYKKIFTKKFLTINMEAIPYFVCLPRETSRQRGRSLTLAQIQVHVQPHFPSCVTWSGTPPDPLYPSVKWAGYSNPSVSLLLGGVQQKNILCWAQLPNLRRQKAFRSPA